MKNWLVRFILQEMRILHAKRLIKHSRGINRDLMCFTLDPIQIIIDIVTLGCGPNIYMEVHNTFFQEFLQSKLKIEGAEWSFAISALIKMCGDQNSIQIKNDSNSPPKANKEMGSSFLKSMTSHPTSRVREQKRQNMIELSFNVRVLGKNLGHKGSRALEGIKRQEN